MLKHKKIIITLLIFILIVTILAMIADQAIGSCCGAESANIEIWWWLAIASEIVALVYLANRK